MFANCMHAIVWRAFSLFFGISSIVWINHTFYCWRTVGLFPMFGFYKDAVCRTVFYESLCDCWGIKQLQWCSNGKGHSCAESTLCGTPRPLCIVSIGRWHFNASTFSQGTPSAGIPWCGFLHLSLKQRERTWQLLCFQTAVEHWCVSADEAAFFLSCHAAWLVGS